jgi:dTDP-4-dehydrorhamnose 3,5-epimerase/CDP-3, 6-dideoxy-D-glycero-D-glycero-4-hexulose-5-epimerase
MELANELLPGAWHIRLRRFEDARGTFVKTFARSAFEAAAPGFELMEEFYSVSAKGVIRGMHFQLPPHDQVKLVYCPVGAVLDVLLDLRAGPGHGRVASAVLSEQEPSLIVVPKGIAHGFCSLEDGSLMVYKTSTEHAPSHDAGIHWNSFGFDWGSIDPPIVSERDRSHPSFDQFATPF